MEGRVLCVRGLWLLNWVFNIWVCVLVRWRWFGMERTHFMGSPLPLLLVTEKASIILLRSVTHTQTVFLSHRRSSSLTKFTSSLSNYGLIWQCRFSIEAGCLSFFFLFLVFRLFFLCFFFGFCFCNWEKYQ